MLAFTRKPFRRDLAWLACSLPLFVLAQAVLGGFTVREHLAPGFVMAHFGLSMLALDRGRRARLAQRPRAGVAAALQRPAVGLVDRGRWRRWER